MPWWVWVLLGALALAGEAISMALFLLNVGIAALVVAVLTLLGINPAVQLGVFVILSVLLIGLVRPRLMARLAGSMPLRSLPEQELLAGRIATVTDTVTDEGGAIRLGKTEFWTARPNPPAQQIEVGSRVRITQVRGLTAYVDPLPALHEAPGEQDAMPLADASADHPRLFADLLRRHRLAAGLTQEELAERAHISVRAVSALERGVNHTPRRDTVELLAEALGLSEQERTAFAEAARGRVLRG